MENATVDAVVRDLQGLLLGSPQAEITGSQLGDLIGQHFPSLNLRRVTGIPTGPGALSRFVDMRLAGLLQLCGKAGADIVYSIRRPGVPAVTPTASDELPELLELRAMVQYAVARMSLDELRKVMIPAGLASEAARHASRP
ncbi:hypothetical protein [Pseudoduganella chitinolytica]|uniref:Uncharacterized protein n=1 Tax=Pseudoduganella chitinolytica TaxID=34070 RepID=A0ABY8BI01_9BURK|nr:hypothetical protein [Pseudoduganella chitinolytica]WEF35525.1 hypothetical protein PX653_12485 [Pseudoduganella chitinolytica]